MAIHIIILPSLDFRNDVEKFGEDERHEGDGDDVVVGVFKKGNRPHHHHRSLEKKKKTEKKRGREGFVGGRGEGEAIVEIFFFERLAMRKKAATNKKHFFFFGENNLMMAELRVTHRVDYYCTDGVALC